MKPLCIYLLTPIKPVTITIEHPSCNGCVHAKGPDTTKCIHCASYIGPKEHYNWEPYKKVKE
jgi:hypothetical protein